MKSRWKTFLLYGGLILVGAGALYLIVETIRAKNTGFESKTLWDWMELLVIPLVLAIGAFFLNRSERKTEREIAKDRQQEAALQAYLDRMSELLLEKKIRTTKKAEVRDVARTRTVSVMRILDRRRNNLVIQFLREAKLITDKNSILNGANMSGMDLQGLILNNIYLQDADLSNANLRFANMQRANMQRTFFRKAYLRQTNLRDANLQGAFLEGANLQDASLENANFSRLNLQGANLQNAWLGNALVTKGQLEQAETLKGATMPDGTIHK